MHVKKLALVSLPILLGGLVVWWLVRPSSPVGTAIAAAGESTKATLPPPSPTQIERVAPATPSPTASEKAVPAQKSDSQTLLRDLLLSGNRIFDAKLGLMATYPADWTVRDAALRWGVNQGENTIFFAPPEGSQADPSLYYRKYSDGPAFDMANPEATLRDMARQKEASRSAAGQDDYKNDPESFVFRTIDGQPSLSYFATYTSNGEVHAEYFLRILGPSGYVMFFNRGPAKDVQALIPTIVEMASNVKPP